MSDYSLDFNVYGSGNGSATGHMNVTFNGPGISVTLGANQDSPGAGMGIRGLFSTTEGLVQNEDFILSSRDHVTRSVPVTAQQFEAIYSSAAAMEDQRYDYAVFGNFFDPRQICSSWANTVYQSTGHPGSVGSLFAPIDETVAPGVIWSFLPGFTNLATIMVAPYVPYSKAYVPGYVPTGPINGHVPDTSVFSLHCFPASTPIAISSTETRPISDIRVGDTVLAFDPSADLGRGALVPRKVVRLYRNTTDEWVKLTWAEGGEAKELIATPGHHFLDQFGNFPTIEAMLEIGRATAGI